MKKIIIICLLALSICGCTHKTSGNETSIEKSKEKLYQVYVEDYDYSQQKINYWSYNSGIDYITFGPKENNTCSLIMKLSGYTYVGNKCEYTIKPREIEINYIYTAFYDGQKLGDDFVSKITGTFPINLKTITINFESQEFELNNIVYKDLKYEKGYKEILVRESDGEVFNLNGKAINGTCSAPDDDCYGNYDYEQINLSDYEIILSDVKIDENRIPILNYGNSTVNEQENAKETKESITYDNNGDDDEIVTRKIENIPVKITNLNSNYLAIAQNENGTNTSVIVRGKRGILRNITGNSDECNKDNCITAEIDLAGYTSGYYDIPVVFKTENRDIEIIDDEQVFVKVLVRSR